MEAPRNKDIYARRVPGISDGRLVEAMQQRGFEKPRDEPGFNNAFSRTSPSLFHHHQNASSRPGQWNQQNQMPYHHQAGHPVHQDYGFGGGGSVGHASFDALNQHNQSPAAAGQPMMAHDLLQTNASSTNDNATQAAVEDAAQALRRRITNLDASVREYHTKEIMRHGEILEQLQSLQCAFNMRTWILIAVGVVLLALLIMLVCMVSKLSVAAKPVGNAELLAAPPPAYARPPPPQTAFPAQSRNVEESSDFI